MCSIIGKAGAVKRECVLKVRMSKGSHQVEEGMTYVCAPGGDGGLCIPSIGRDCFCGCIPGGDEGVGTAGGERYNLWVHWGGDEGVGIQDEHEGVFYSRLREVQIMGTLGGDEGVLYTR